MRRIDREVTNSAEILAMMEKCEVLRLQVQERTAKRRR